MNSFTILQRFWHRFVNSATAPWTLGSCGVVLTLLSGLPVLADPPSVYPAALAKPSATPPPSLPKRHNLPELTAAPIPTTVQDSPELTLTAALLPASLPATLPATLPAPSSAPLLTRDAAVRWALQYNPELAATRQQHGIAAANIVIANTYPMNPILEARVRNPTGPESAGITNRVEVESTLLLELEVRGQRRIRRVGAAAGLSRTDNEIAFQELTLAVRAGRAYDTLLYRREKAALADEAVRLTQQAVEQVRRLVEAGRLRAADLIIITTELNDFLAQASMARAAVPVAYTELRNALGVIDGMDVSDTLDTPALQLDAKVLVPLALERRPDRQAREAAVAEAESRLKLEVAGRYGNPVFGPSFQYDPTRITSIGAQLAIPIPAFNRRNGEILQREVERDRALLDLRQSEVQVEHDVVGALARAHAARDWSDLYRAKILPELKTSVESIERLFTQGDASVDILRVLDVRRKLLRARDGYLDALWEQRQAQADLAAALGDPALLAPSLRGACAAPTP